MAPLLAPGAEEAPFLRLWHGFLTGRVMVALTQQNGFYRDQDKPSASVALTLAPGRTLDRSQIAGIVNMTASAVPGLSAKPIIDVQVEVNDMDEVVERVVPLMEELGYEFIWRPSIGESEPFYAWFIGRDARGERTEHIHIVAPDHTSAERIIFRDLLRRHPAEAAAYEELKTALAKKHAKDRVAYTQGKTEFIKNTLRKGRDGTLR